MNVPTLIPARKAGTQFTYLRGMESWVDVGIGYIQNNESNALIKAYTSIYDCYFYLAVYITGIVKVKKMKKNLKEIP